MKCPHCGIDVPVGATECAGCGVIFAKLKKKLESLESTPPKASSLWKGRVIALAIVAVWLLAFGLYYHRVLSR